MDTQDIVIQITNIIGGGNVYSAWEPSSCMGNHQTITTIKGKWFGRIGTKRPSTDILAMPAMTVERSNAVMAHYAAEYQRAYKAIRNAYPNVSGRPDMGEICIDKVK